MKKIIRELHSDLDYFNNQNITFHKNYKSINGHSWAQWGDYQEWINYNIVTLDSVKNLVKSKRYRDCYLLLRPVLEAYLIIKLSMIGNRYFLDISPIKKGSGNVRESKGDLMNRVNNEPSFLNNPNVLSKKLIDNKKGDYRVRVILKTTPVENTKVFVPGHYFFAKEFDPDVSYLSKLIIRNRWSDVQSKKIEERSKINKDLRQKFFEIKSLLDFFKINKFSTTRQAQAIFVHYNYLSKYVHATVQSYGTISSGQTMSYCDDPSHLDKYDFFHELLILLYSTFLSLYFCELQIQYFDNEPDLKLTSLIKKNLKEKIKEINHKYSFFWFIYNEPHSHDIFQYKIKKGPSREYKTKPKIPYYVNPLQRLKDLSSGWGNASLGTYHPPKILSED